MWATWVFFEDETGISSTPQFTEPVRNVEETVRK